MPLPLLPLGVAAGVAYFATKKPAPGSKATANVKNPNSAPGPATSSQPSQKYPFTAPVPPRVDNQNQPWYNQGPLPSNPAGNVQTAAGIAGATSSIVQSLSNIWGNVMPNGDTANTPDSNLQASDEVQGDAETSVSDDEYVSSQLPDASQTSVNPEMGDASYEGE